MKLQNYSSPLILILLCAGLLGSSCTRNFDSINTNPEDVITASTESLFARACLGATNGPGADFQQYYDVYRDVNPWMELWVYNGGNPTAFNEVGANFNYRYGIYYQNVGNYLADIMHKINSMSDADKAKYQNELAIAQILNVYYAWYVSDINGDIPYTQAFQLRYGGTDQPKYDYQDSLFTIWDTQLKQAVSTLKSNNSAQQVSYGNYDLFYNGDVSKWIKAGTSLRLKIAMRLMKRNPSMLSSIANEVIASGDLMSSNDDNWIFYARNGSTGPGGNWDPTGFVAPRPMVDFMWNTSDPRIGLFFQKNDYDSLTFVALQQQGKISPDSSWNPRQYVGMFCSPDAIKTPLGRRLIFRDTLKQGGNNILLDTLSLIQYRLFQAEYPDQNGNIGQGNTPFVMLTYPDVCLMRAELAARGLTTEDPAQWYYEGIKASISMYDQLASMAKIFDYNSVAVTQQAINNYLNNPTIQYNPAKGIQQICVQEFINYFKQFNEAWALWKRTGYPDSTTDLVREPLQSGGQYLEIPRRAVFNNVISGAPNYDNVQAALQHMSSDPDWGTGPADVYGRVWWDKK